MVLPFVLETLEAVTGIFSSFVMLPQIYRNFKRKSTKDISIWTYLYMLGVGVIWLLCRLNIRNVPILVSNLISSLAMIGIIVGWFLYGK